MRVLVACEESQRVCMAFRERGHEAYSCDIQECSGGHPEWHILGDVLPLLNGHCEFTLQDGNIDRQTSRWDLIIAHPPCTHLSVSGATYFEKKRADGRQREGIEFFCQFLIADCDKIAIENPVGIISGDYVKKWFPDLVERYGLPIKPNQIIQPYEYGHPYTKKTCLWLKNLPTLKPTNILEKPSTGWVNQCFTPDGRYGGFKAFNGSKERSKTFPGIAKAMAEQWGTIATDRKTENSSEKPNNSTISKMEQVDEPQTEDWQDWKDKMWAEAIVTEPTISKMEQVDEPQTERSSE